MYVLLVPLFLLFSATAAGADPFSAQWTADASHSDKRSVGLRPESLRIEAEGARVIIVESGTSPAGAAYSFKITADCDGKPNGVIGSSEIDAVQCWRNDNRTLVLKLLREGAPREFRTAEVAKNGQTLRLTSTVEDAKGKEEKSVAVFARR